MRLCSYVDTCFPVAIRVGIHLLVLAGRRPADRHRYHAAFPRCRAHRGHRGGCRAFADTRHGSRPGPGPAQGNRLHRRARRVRVEPPVAAHAGQHGGLNGRRLRIGLPHQAPGLSTHEPLPCARFGHAFRPRPDRGRLADPAKVKGLATRWTFPQASSSTAAWSWESFSLAPAGASPASAPARPQRPSARDSCRPPGSWRQCWPAFGCVTDSWRGSGWARARRRQQPALIGLVKQRHWLTIPPAVPPCFRGWGQSGFTKEKAPLG